MMITFDMLSRLSSQKQSIAQKMLFEQRKILAVEKSMQQNSASQNSPGSGSPGPRLGRGLGSGDYSMKFKCSSDMWRKKA
jgi:hypothetical protein